MTNMPIQPLWLTYFIEILLVLEFQLTKTYFGTFSYKTHFRPQISSNVLTIVARPLMYLNYREHCPPYCTGLNVVWGYVYTVGYKKIQNQLHTHHPMLHLTLYRRVDIARPDSLYLKQDLWQDKLSINVISLILPQFLKIQI